MQDKNNSASFLSLTPFLLFLFLFLGSGLYFHFKGIEFAFYQISPTVAIIPAIILSVLLGKDKFGIQIDRFIEGVRDKDIITMCMIFILSGAFGVVTEAIGATNETVQFSISILPASALLPGLFLISSFISTAMGTSMGVIAAITPIAVGISNSANIPMSEAVATVICGAMFGDNLSIISDTTIAAVQSQGADLKKKFILNFKLAFIAALCYVLYLLLKSSNDIEIVNQQFNLIKITPFLAIIILAMCGLHVFQVLILGIILSWIIGCFTIDYNIINFSKDLYIGFKNMNEIMILSMLIGGLSSLIKSQGGIDFIFNFIEKFFMKKKISQQRAELAISSLVSINDIFIANNTIAIILSGELAKKIANKYNISKERSACFLDIWSCVFQGVLPYSAQILLASSLCGVAPLILASKIYYCFILGIVTLLYIIFGKNKKIS